MPEYVRVRQGTPEYAACQRSFSDDSEVTLTNDTGRTVTGRVTGMTLLDPDWQAGHVYRVTVEAVRDG